MALTAGAADLGADHAVARVAHKGDVGPVERFKEARPPGSGLELRAGAEEGQAAQPADIGALALVRIEHAAKRGLSNVLQDDLALFLSQVGGKRLVLISGRGPQIEAGVRTWGRSGSF